MTATQILATCHWHHIYQIKIICCLKVLYHVPVVPLSVLKIRFILQIVITVIKFLQLLKITFNCKEMGVLSARSLGH